VLHDWRGGADNGGRRFDDELPVMKVDAGNGWLIA